MGTILGWLPEWAKTKLGMRMAYTCGSFIAARLVSFLTGTYVNHGISLFIAFLAKMGVVVVIQIVSINERVLEAAITGCLMIAGEWGIQHFHETQVLPVVAPKAQIAAESVTEKPTKEK